MFPTDTLTIFHELVGASTYTLYSSGTRYVIGLSIQQSATNSTSVLKCGSNVIATNYGKSLPYNQMYYLCNGELSISKTGNDNASFIISTSQSGITNTVYDNNVNLSYGDVFKFEWLFFGIVVFAIGSWIGTNVFRR